MRTLALLTALSVSVAGCGLLSKATGGKSDALKSDAEAKKREAEAKKAEADAKVAPAKEAQKCEQFRKQMPSIEEETALGQAVALTFIGEKGLLVDSANEKSPANELNLYLNRVGKNLAAQSSRPNLEWTFAVVDSDEFNAYSAPGGYVLVTKGLLKQVDNEAQLAGVLSHEIAHVTQRHALRTYANVKANQCQAALTAKYAAAKAADTDEARQLKQWADKFEQSLGAPGGHLDLNKAGGKLLGALAEKVVGEITSKGFAHSDEFGADAIAADLITAAGYSPKEFVTFLPKIPADGGVFKNHPKTDERRNKLGAWRNALKQKMATDPLVFDPDSKDLKVVPLKDELAFIKK